MIKNHKNVQIVIDGRAFFCPVEVTMSVMAASGPLLFYGISKAKRCVMVN